MSVYRAMNQATLELIRANGGFAEEASAITRKGKPRPGFGGDFFLSVWGGQQQWRLKTAQEVWMQNNLTLTKRFTKPHDRDDEELIQEEYGIMEQMNYLCSLLYSLQNEIRDRADELMPEGYKGFVTAPKPMSVTDAEDCGPQWFGGSHGHETRGSTRGQYSGGDAEVYGLKTTVTFGDWSFIHPWDTGRI